MWVLNWCPIKKAFEQISQICFFSFVWWYTICFSLSLSSLNHLQKQLFISIINYWLKFKKLLYTCHKLHSHSHNAYHLMRVFLLFLKYDEYSKDLFNWTRSYDLLDPKARWDSIIIVGLKGLVGFKYYSWGLINLVRF